MYIVVCRYNNGYTKWGIYDSKDGFSWFINNNTVPYVLYKEDNKFDCLRIKI